MQKKRLESANVGLTRALAWVLASAILADVSWSRIVSLRTAGQRVGVYRYVLVGWCLSMVVLWMWMSWKSWKRFLEERKVS